MALLCQVLLVLFFYFNLFFDVLRDFYIRVVYCIHDSLSLSLSSYFFAPHYFLLFVYFFVLLGLLFWFVNN